MAQEKSQKAIFKLLQFKKWPLYYQIIVPLAGVVFLLVVFFLIWNLAYWRVILPRTYLGSTNFGKNSKTEALKLLSEKSEALKEAQIQIEYQDKNWTLKTSDLNLNYDTEKTQENLKRVGRKGGFGKIILEQFKSIFGKNKPEAVYNLDQSTLNNFILKIAQEIDIPEKDASLELKDGEILVINEASGKKVEIFKTKNQILKALKQMDLKEKIILEVQDIYPKVKSSQVEEAKKQAQKFLESDLTLKGQDKTYFLKKDDIVPFIDFVGVLKKSEIVEEKSIGKLKTKEENKEDTYTLRARINPQKIHEYLGGLAQEIYQEPKDAKFEVRGGKVVAFQLAQTGYILDEEKASSQVIEAIFKGHKETLELPIKVKEPEIGSDSAEKIGIKEMVGEATTDFSGSPENRRHNIRVGAMSFHGIIVKPGEEFSTLKYLGQIDASTGYLPELVIKEDRTIPEYGGGLCQVSTTMFRTVLETGLKVTERQNHSYRVRYYEPPVGMDATVYEPKPDFKFVNDMETPILIQASVGTNTLTFSFYGTKDGRRAESSDPNVYDVVGAGEPIYTESPDLANGEIKQVEKAHPGSKASFKYTVWDKNNKVINEQTFTSSYVPWPARYLYGPGTQIPPPENPE